MKFSRLSLALTLLSAFARARPVSSDAPSNVFADPHQGVAGTLTFDRDVLVAYYEGLAGGDHHLNLSGLPDKFVVRIENDDSSSLSTATAVKIDPATGATGELRFGEAAFARFQDSFAQSSLFGGCACKCLCDASCGIVSAFVNEIKPLCAFCNYCPS